GPIGVPQNAAAPRRIPSRAPVREPTTSTALHDRIRRSSAHTPNPAASTAAAPPTTSNTTRPTGDGDAPGVDVEVSGPVVGVCDGVGVGAVVGSLDSGDGGVAGVAGGVIGPVGGVVGPVVGGVVGTVGSGDGEAAPGTSQFSPGWIRSTSRPASRSDRKSVV